MDIKSRRAKTNVKKWKYIIQRCLSTHRDYIHKYKVIMNELKMNSTYII